MTEHVHASIDAVWRDLVTAALLGADRREPRLPAGPVGELVADGVVADGAERLLTAVAATAAVRRAAFVPRAPAAGLQPPDADPRPVVSPPAAATWRTVVRDWPVLEDEWMLAVIANGWRLPADVLVDALARHRRDPVRHVRAARAGGPLTAWVIDHVPELAPSGRRSVPAEAVTSLPELPVPPELAELLTVDAHTFVRRLVPFVDTATAASKPVIVNLLARCRREVLADTAEALAVRPSGLAAALADLCRVRDRMLAELAR